MQWKNKNKFNGILVSKAVMGDFLKKKRFISTSPKKLKIEKKRRY